MLTRREMLKGAAVALVVVAAPGLRRPSDVGTQSTTRFASVAASNEDKVIVPTGYRYVVPGLTDKATYQQPGSRFPDYRPDMPPRPSVVAVYRDDGGKIGT